MTTQNFGRSSTPQAATAARYATPRRLERPTFGPQIAEAAKLLGTPLMPWQADFADVLGEYDPDTGIPFYQTAFFTVPRQSGKTLLLLAWCIRKCLSDRSMRLAWSAQSGKDARDKWIDELFPMIEGSKLTKMLAPHGLSRGMGNEKIQFKNGSLIRLVSNSAKAGHGKTLHGDAEDEIFADVDNWRAQAFGPAMLTVADAQSLKTSTAGTMASTIYNSLRRAGRNAVTEDVDEGICYLEYSADKDWDFMDPNTYRGHMPAVGHTVSEKSVKAAIDAMLLDPKEGEEGVRRAYGNNTAGAGAGTIPEAVWERVCGRDVKPEGRLTFGVAVSQDRSSASVAVCDEAGNAELIDNRGGTGWLIERVNGLVERSDGARVVLDGGGPAGSLAENLDSCEPLKGSEVIEIHGSFFDAVVECSGIRVRSDAGLDKSVEGAVKKMIADRFVWSRNASTEDITPLEALTLAWGARHGEAPPEMYVGFS